MLDDLPLIGRLSSMASHASARHRTLAENIAHANTPGYRARDLVAFSDVIAREGGGLRGAGPAPARATRSDHVRDASDARATPFRIREIDVPGAPNGNTVVVEDQVMRAAEAESQHRLALRLYLKATELMRLGLGRLR